MTDANVTGFEPLYDQAEHTDRRIPWDIGGPQPAVQQLVAYGGIRGAVLDPLLENRQVHLPVWSVVATRLD